MGTIPWLRDATGDVGTWRSGSGTSRARIQDTTGYIQPHQIHITSPDQPHPARGPTSAAGYLMMSIHILQ